MKVVLPLIIALMACPFLLSANTFILKNGKRIEGTVQIEEASCLRIVDSTGVKMTLKKDSLDWTAMRIANQQAQTHQTETQRVTPAPAETKSSNAHTVVLTNRDVATAQPRYRNTKEAIRDAERELNRLSDACRSAGASSPSMRVWRTTTYIVHGKRVTVSGYWAHPANIENAKRICASAIQAQQNLNRLLATAGAP